MGLYFDFGMFTQRFILMFGLVCVWALFQVWNVHTAFYFDVWSSLRMGLYFECGMFTQRLFLMFGLVFVWVSISSVGCSHGVLFWCLV